MTIRFYDNEEESVNFTDNYCYEDYKEVWRNEKEVQQNETVTDTASCSFASTIYIRKTNFLSSFEKMPSIETVKYGIQVVDDNDRDLFSFSTTITSSTNVNITKCQLVLNDGNESMKSIENNRTTKLSKMILKKLNSCISFYNSFKPFWACETNLLSFGIFKAKIWMK